MMILPIPTLPDDERSLSRLDIALMLLTPVASIGAGLLVGWLIS